MNALQIFRTRFAKILENDEPRRSWRLRALMYDLERAYDIPLLYSATFESNNPAVMRLYRKASSERNFEEVNDDT